MPLGAAQEGDLACRRVTSPTQSSAGERRRERRGRRCRRRSRRPGSSRSRRPAVRRPRRAGTGTSSRPARTSGRSRTSGRRSSGVRWRRSPGRSRRCRRPRSTDDRRCGPARTAAGAAAGASRRRRARRRRAARASTTTSDEPGRAGAAERRARKVVSTGSHLSRLDHAGRWRVAARPREDLVEVVGHAVLGLLVRASRETVAVEAVVRSSCRTALRELGPRSGVGVERRAHRPERSVEARLRRPERDPERRRRPPATAGRGSDAGR